MKAARTLLLALVAFGAVTSVVAQPPGPVTPPACQMACHKGEYAKVQACGSDADCVAQVKADIASCMAACPATPSKSMVGYYSCQSCTGDYSQCSSSCSAGDANCLGSCINMFMGCMGQCDDSVSSVAPVESTPVGDYCQCDAVYDRCLPNCNGMSRCQTQCMQNHFDCRMQTPGCFKVSETLGETKVGDKKKQTLCHMACVGVEAAGNAACKNWMAGSQQCLDNVKSAREVCDMGCGLLKATTPVTGSACEAGCNSEYGQCIKSGGSPTSCYRAQKQCFDICHMHLETEKSAIVPALTAVASAHEHQLQGVECATACLISQKTASLLCYAYPANLKPLCFQHLDEALDVCQTLCQFSPIMAEAPKAVVPVESTPVGDYCQCDAVYDRCLPNCNGMSRCQTQCMQNHFDCRMQTPGCFKVSETPKLGATKVGDKKKQTLCHMACVGVEASGNAACKYWMTGSQQCLDNVKSAREMCDMGCGLLKAPAALPALKGTACEASCNADYNHCMKAPGSSYSRCARDQSACFKLCHQNVASPFRRVAAQAQQARVGDQFECDKCANGVKNCFDGCNLDPNCIGKCFENDFQCQLSC